MSNVLQFLNSSIGRKVVMALTGLLLIGFLVTHLAGNLLILSPSPKAFNDYSHALISNPLIYIAEGGLLVLFVVHLVNGIRVTVQNRAARPVAYRQTTPAGHTSHKTIASTTMILSGLVVLAFVPLHLWTFKFGTYYTAAGEPGVRDLHRLVVAVFQDPLHVGWYVVAMGVIGFHLWHGFGSGFESLGVAYRVPLRRAGQVLAVVLSGGFAAIPLILFLTGGAQ
jgi:succinate dehydrogenase / fumarate reductase cytochrome b subunit